MIEKQNRPAKDKQKRPKNHDWMSNIIFHARLIFNDKKPGQIGK